MSGLPLKLQSILRKLREDEDKRPSRRKIIRPAPEQDQPHHNAYFVSTANDIQIIAAEVKAARMRLEDIHTRLSLSLRSGLASESIH